MTKRPESGSELTIVEDLDAKCNDPSDIISVSDLDSLLSDSSDTKNEADPRSSVHTGKVVVIEDIAFVT